jgi:hypothetical protein
MVRELMLRDVVETDLTISYEQRLDTESSPMAAFTPSTSGSC